MANDDPLAGMFNNLRSIDEFKPRPAADDKKAPIGGTCLAAPCPHHNYSTLCILAANHYGAHTCAEGHTW